MDLPLRLSILLQKDDDDEEEEEGKLYELISQWNENVERFLSSPPPAPVIDSRRKEVTGNETDSYISQVSFELYKRIISSIHSSSSSSSTATTVLPTMITEASTTRSSQLEEEIALTTKRHHLETNEIDNLINFSCSIRAARNLLRWYIQIYLESKGRHQVPSPSLVRCLQSKAMIELLVSVLGNSNIDLESNERTKGILRDISLYLFYATYIPFPGGGDGDDDDDSQRALSHLIFDLSFTEIAIRRLLTRRPPCTTGLMLSLIRNIHTALVTLQGAAKKIVDTKIEWDPPTDDDDDDSLAPPPWAPKEKCIITFSSICIDLLRWSLDSDPAFPGKKEQDSGGNDDDRRAELVIEILGAFYALRMGQNMNPKLLQISLDILRIIPTNSNNINKEEETMKRQLDQCKCSVVSLLMDSDPTVGVELLKNDAINPLLTLFESQVTSIIENVRVDDSAAATILPILVVLNNFASTNLKIRQIIKGYIFPPDAEATFREKVQEQLRTTNQKNMQALDAPKGTFRWKLISLMTWPQSHIKRFTGELFWTLCSSDANEFVHRIGFGNGMPLLGAKGLVKMPQGASTIK